MLERPLELIHVDDDPHFRWLVKEFTSGHNMVQFEDPLEVLEEISGKTGVFDALLTDNVMLSMSGIALATKVRTMDSGLHIVLITAGHIDRIEVGSARLFNQILQKPFARTDFLSMLSNIQPRQRG